MKLKNVLEGWGKAMHLMQVTPAEQRMSEERIRVCSACPIAKESKFLKLIGGTGLNLDTYHCSICKCPVNQKSLVKDETCPLGKWEIK